MAYMNRLASHAGFNTERKEARENGNKITIRENKVDIQNKERMKEGTEVSKQVTETITDQVGGRGEREGERET